MGGACLLMQTISDHLADASDALKKVLVSL